MADYDDRSKDLLRRAIASLDSLHEITAYISAAYYVQSKFGSSPLPPAVAKPDGLIVQALNLAGPDGLTRKRLREVVPVGQERFDRALGHLQATGQISRSKEPRPNSCGRRQYQIVWRIAQAQNDSQETDAEMREWSHNFWAEMEQIERQGGE